MITAPGRQMPQIAARAPAVPRKRSPTRTAIFVAFRPGKVWLMESNSTKVLSSSHWYFVTRLLRKYATTPPPKLVAPITRKVVKIFKTEISPERAGGWTSSGPGGGMAETLFVALRCIALQLVDHSRFGRAQRKPVLDILLQGDKELLRPLFDLVVDVFAAIEFDLE